MRKKRLAPISVTPDANCAPSLHLFSHLHLHAFLTMSGGGPSRIRNRKGQAEAHREPSPDIDDDDHMDIQNPVRDTYAMFNFPSHILRESAIAATSRRCSRRSRSTSR